MSDITAMGTICGVLIGGLTLLLAIQWRRSTQIQNAIVSSVNNLSDILQAKLETKERVNQIAVDLATLKEQMRSVTEPRGRRYPN